MAREVFYQVQVMLPRCKTWEVMRDEGPGMPPLFFIGLAQAKEEAAGEVEHYSLNRPGLETKAVRARVVKHVYTGRGAAPVCDVVWDSEDGE